MYIDHHIKQVGKVLTCTDSSGKIVVNKYDNKTSRIIFDLDGTIPGKLYFALLNPTTKKYFLTPINNNEIEITSAISVYPGLWSAIIIGADANYEIIDNNIDQTKLTYISDEFKKIVVRDNFLNELNIEESQSPANLFDFLSEAQGYVVLSKRYAVGDDKVEGSDVDNAKYYMNETKKLFNDFEGTVKDTVVEVVGNQMDILGNEIDRVDSELNQALSETNQSVEELNDELYHFKINAEERIKTLEECDIDVDITVDSELNPESENPIQNKVVTKALDNVTKDIVDVKSDLNELEERVDGLSGGGSGATEEQLAQIEQNKTDIYELRGALDEKQPKGNYASKSELISEESARKVEIAIERARIDAFVALPEGSTTGDAELTDARVDYRGETWNSVGDHVRGVTDILLEQFDSIANNETKYVLFKKGYISVSTGIENNSIKRGVITPTYFEKGEIYLSDFTNYALRLFQYDKDGNFIKYIGGIPQRYNLLEDGYIYKLMVFERATAGNSNPSKAVLDDMMKCISITFHEYIKTLAHHGRTFSGECTIKNNTTYSQCKFMSLSLEGNFENVKFVDCDFVMTRIVGKLRNVVIDSCRFIGHDARIQTTEMYNCVIVNNDFPIDSDEYSVTPKTKGEHSRNIFARVMNKCRIQNNHIYIGRTGICCLGEQTILNNNNYDNISSCDNIITGNIVDGIGEEHISFDASPIFDVGKIVDVSINFVEVGTGQIINGQGDNSEQTKIVARTTISMKTDLVGTHTYNDTKHIKNYANMLKGLHIVSLKDSKNYKVNGFTLTGNVVSDSDGLSFSNEGTYSITVDIPTIYNYYNAIDDEKKNTVINNIKSDLAVGDFLYIGGVQSNNIISHNTINGIGTDTITSISDMGGIVLYGVCLNNVISDNILNQKRIWLIEWNNKTEAYVNKVKMQSNNILKGNILHNTSISLNRLSAGGFGDLKLSRNNKLIANTVTGFSEVAGIMIDGFADTVLVGNHSHHYRIRNCDGLKLIGNSKETTEHGAYFYQNTNVKQDVTDDITT